VWNSGVGILRLGPGPLRFRGMVGTGGIGHGTFFLIEGSQTLGREESRQGRFLDRRDYCKLHIVGHYLKALLGDAMLVYPIGKVGGDDAGRRLRAEMEAVGLDTRFVETDPAAATLYSFCFLYPDGSGGNLTTADSASGRVDAVQVAAAEGIAAELGREGIALAVPEVSLEARRALVHLASRYGLFRAASFTRAEIGEARRSGLLEQLDLLAVNLEEALAAAGISGAPAPGAPSSGLVQQAVEAISRAHPQLLLSITAGAAGSWSWDGRTLAHDPAAQVRAAGTAGAGDAYLAGLLAGMAAGLALAESQHLATLVAGASVLSPHTIHPGMTLDTLRSACCSRRQVFPRVRALLDMPMGGS